MDRNIPQFNRIIINKIQQKNLQTHYKKLSNIQKSRKRTAASLNMSKYDLKKQQLEQQRQTEIQKSNVLLFQKMNRIMKRTDPLNQKITHRYKIASNKFAEHIQKINQQNQYFFQRLCASKPTIDNKKIFQQRQKQLCILKLLGRNPLQISSERQKLNLNDISQNNKSNRYEIQTSDSKTIRNRYKTSSMVRLQESLNLQLNSRPQYTQPDQQDQHIRHSQEYFKKQMNKIQQRKKKVKSSMEQTNYQHNNRAKSQVNSQIKLKTKLQSQPQKYSILFNTFKLINNCMYKVLILRKTRHYQFVCIQVNNTNKRIYLQLDQSKANNIFSSIDYDFQSIVDCLSIKDHILTINTSLLDIQQNMPSSLKMKKINKKYNSSITEQPNQYESTVYFQLKKEDNKDPLFATFQAKK